MSDNKNQREFLSFFFPIEERIIWTSGVGSTQKEKWGDKLGMFWGKIGAMPPTLPPFHLFFFFFFHWGNEVAAYLFLEFWGRSLMLVGRWLGRTVYRTQEAERRPSERKPWGNSQISWENLFKIMRLEVPVIILFHVGRWCLHGG